MIEELSRIIKKQKEEELIALLKVLTPEQKKELVPHIKKLTKEYNEYKSSITGSYGYVGTDLQRHLLLYAGFVCFNRTDFEKNFFSVWMLEEKHLGKIIHWYCPEWFSDFVNKQANEDFVPVYLSYQWMMQLHKGGYLNPSKELIAKLLINSIFETKDRETIYKPDNVLIYKETLEQHIWYLFECETNLHYSDRWLRFGKDVSKEKIGWVVLLKQLTTEGKIDRYRVLKEALLASNKNFNKILSGWFSDLFTELSPSIEEIVGLQTEIFSTFSSPQSKPVNTGLQAVKKVVQTKEFDAGNFLHYAPVLLSSTTKSVVASTLMIMEKLGKKKKELQAQICEQAVQVFVLQDDELQTRASKLIAEFAAAVSDSFSQVLMPYTESMMSNSKKLLENFIAKENHTSTASTVFEESCFDEEEQYVPIEYPQSIDDFIFLASQAFDNNQSWHFELFAGELIIWLPQFKAEDIDRFEPILQRALKMTKTGLRAGQGSLDHMLAIFFIDVCVFLTRKYPNVSPALQSMFKKFEQQDGDITRSWLAILTDSSYISDWNTHYKDLFYNPHKKLLIATLEKIKDGERLSLLSTPTHEPGWVSPDILVERLITYQQTNKLPSDIDFQIAVSRCLLKNTENAMQLAERNLKGEILNLLLFLFGKHEAPVGPFTLESIWMCCSLALKEKKQYKQFENFSYYKSPFAVFTGNFPWKSFEEEYASQKYDYSGGSFKTIPFTDKRKILKVYIDKSKIISQISGLKKFLSPILPKVKNNPELIYGFFTFKQTWFSAESDFRRVLLLAPNNPDPFVIEVVCKCLEHPTFWSEEDKKMVIAVLHALNDIWDEFGEPSHLMLATCLLSSDKTVLNIAGEIWQKGISKNKINNVLLGKIIGKHESIEFAPLKRLTDLVSLSLLRISPLHNKKLQELIENILAELPETPIKNLKKLLEIYYELTQENSIKVKADVLKKIRIWNNTASLQKVTNQIIINSKV